MRSLRRALQALIFVFPIVVLGLMTYSIVKQFPQDAEPGITRELEVRLGKMLGHEVHIGRVYIRPNDSIFGPPTTRIYNLHIAQGEKLADGLMVRAPKAELNIDLRDFLFDPNRPFIANIDIEKPWVRITRSRVGHWNFEDMFHKQPEEVARQAVGTVHISNGTLEYDDEDAPRHQNRPHYRLQAAAINVNGKLQFNKDKTITWSAAGNETTGAARTLAILGSYEPELERLYVRIDATEFALKLVTALISPDNDVVGGSGNGRLTWLRQKNGRGAPENDIQVSGNIESGILRSARLNELISGVNGSVSTVGEHVTAYVTGDLAGAQLRYSGAVHGFSKPILNGHFSGSGLQMKRILAALDSKAILRDFPELRSISASGALEADVAGPLDNPIVQASMPIVVSGMIKNGPSIPRPTPMQIAISGPARKPYVKLSAVVPLLRYKDNIPTDVKVYAEIDEGRVVTDFSGILGGGTFSGRADIRPNGKKTTYTANVRARGIDASRIRIPDIKTARGLVDFDASITGRLDQEVPQGAGLVQVSGLKYDKLIALSTTARIHSVGDLVYLDALRITDPSGTLVGTGFADFKSKSMKLKFEMDEVNLARLPIEKRDNGTPLIEGTGYVREGRISGPFKHPTVEGVIRGYGVEAGSTGKLDYVSVRFAGNRDRLTIDQGAHAWRFPAYIRLSGYIDNPLSHDSSLHLSGDFNRVDLQDLAEIAGSALEASGTASGNWSATGSLIRPVIVSQNLSVNQPGVGKFGFESLNAAVTYDGTKSPSEIRFDNVVAKYSHSGQPDKPDAVITGNGIFFSDKTFQAHASGKDALLEAVLHAAGEYIIPEGTAEFTADLFGALDNGKTERLRGTMLAGTQNLKVNQQDIGDLLAEFKLTDTIISGTVHPKNAPAGTDSSGAYLTYLRYDTAKDDLTLDARLKSIPLEVIRKAIANSPSALTDETGVIASTLKSLKPLVGLTDTHINVSGKLQDPVTTVRWEGQGVEIQNQPLDKFTGTAELKSNHIQIKQAALAFQDALVTLEGDYVPDERLSGFVEATNVPLALLRKWFPEQADLQGLEGKAEHIRVDASGKPKSPSVVATVDVKDVKWTDPNAQRHLFGGRAIEFRQISTSTITVENSKLNVTDLSVKIVEPAHVVVSEQKSSQKAIKSAKTANTSPPSTGQILGPPSEDERPRVVYEVLLSGSTDFSWTAPMVPEDSQVTLNIRVKDQGLGILYAFLPNPKLILEGKVEEASLTYEGPWKTLADPRKYAEQTGGEQPVLNGKLNVTADRIALAGSATSVKDLKAKLIFDGRANRLHVEQLTARTEISNPRYASRKGEDVTVTGDLRIHEGPGAPELKIAVPKLVFAEVPLPGLKSGAAIGEVSTNSSTSTAPQFLALGGTVFNPEIAGTIYIRNTDLRLPDSIESKDTAVAFALPFSKTNLKFVADRNVRISTSQLSATVHTSTTEPIMLTGSGNDPRITGSLVVDRGTLQFPTAFFNILKGGEIALRYPYYPAGIFSDKQLGVIVNLTATTRITATSVTGMRRRYTVTVEARGPINSPAPLNITDPSDLGTNPASISGLRLAFRSDPPDLERSSNALQRRMTEVLGGQSAIEGMFSGNFNVGGVASNIFSQSILPGLFERSGIAGALGLQDFAVEYNREDRFSFRVSRDLFGPLFLEYWRSLSPVNRTSSSDWGAWEFKLGYHLRSNMQFSWTYNEQRTNAFLLEGVFKY